MLASPGPVVWAALRAPAACLVWGSVQQLCVAFAICQPRSTCPPPPSRCLPVSGLNIYDVLEECYHGHNPYRGQPAPQTQQAQQQAAQRARAATAGLQEEQDPSPAALSEALQRVRQWPLLGGAREGQVPGLVEMGLGHTPPCLDSRQVLWDCHGLEVVCVYAGDCGRLQACLRIACDGLSRLGRLRAAKGACCCLVAVPWRMGRAAMLLPAVPARPPPPPPEPTHTNI